MSMKGQNLLAAAKPAVVICKDAATARELLAAWPLQVTAVQRSRPGKAARGQPPGDLAARQDRACTHLRGALDYWRRHDGMPNQRELRDALKINSQTACDLARMLRAMPGAGRAAETVTSG
jgi:hypothetical protein